MTPIEKKGTEPIEAGTNNSLEESMTEVNPLAVRKKTAVKSNASAVEKAKISKKQRKLKFNMLTQELTPAVETNPIGSLAGEAAPGNISPNGSDVAETPGTAPEKSAKLTEREEILQAMGVQGADMTTLMKRLAKMDNIHLVNTTTALPTGTNEDNRNTITNDNSNVAECSRTPVRETEVVPNKKGSPPIQTSEFNRTQATVDTGEPVFVSTHTKQMLKKYTPMDEEVVMPKGIPSVDLYTFTPQKLFDFWRTENADDILFAETKDKIKVPAKPLQDMIPNSMFHPWQQALMVLLRAQKANKACEMKDVLDVRSLTKYWEQPGRPKEVVTALMQYDQGELEVPQWPRLTTRTILQVFPNLQNADTEFIQDQIASRLSKDTRFKHLLAECWSLFQGTRDLLDLPDVNPQDAMPKLRLERDIWIPNAPSFQHAQARATEFKANKTTEVPPAMTYKQVASAIGQRTPEQAARAKPSKDNSGNPDYREPQRRRTDVTTSWDAIWHMAKLTGISPTPEVMALAKASDAKANAEDPAPRSGTKNQPSLSEVPDSEKCLSDGRHEFGLDTYDDLDSIQSLSSSDNSDNSDSSSGSETNSDYYDISSSSSDNTDDDSDGSTDPDYDPDYAHAKESENPDDSQDKSKKGGEDKSKRTNKSKKAKQTKKSKTHKSRSSDKDMKNKKRKSERKATRKSDLKDKTTAAIVTAEAYLAQANKVDPECPLPYLINNKVAAADYLMWGMPKVSGFAYKAIIANHKEYVEKGKISWDNWSFSIRDTCRNLGWTHDQSWRVDTRLLPDKLQGHVYDMVQSKGFQGLCWNTWSLLVCKHTDQMNAITVAKHELATLAFEENEQVPEFLSRFHRIVQKATTESNGIEDPLTPLAVLTHLNRIISNPGKKGPGWIVTSWKQQFTMTFGALRTKNTMGINEQGVRYSTSECDANVSEAISCLTDFLRNLHETRQTTTNDINVLFANSHYGTNEPNGQPAPTNDSQPKHKKFGKRKFNSNYSGITPAVANAVTHSGTHKKGVSCRGSKSRTWTDVQRQPWGSGGIPPGTDNVTPTAMLVEKDLPEIPAFDPKWAKLPPMPIGSRLSCHAQAAVEFGVVPYPLAVERYKAFKCAACGRLRDDCKKQAECTGLPKEKLTDIVNRSKFLWVTEQHRRAAQ